MHRKQQKSHKRDIIQRIHFGTICCFMMGSLVVFVVFDERYDCLRYRFYSFRI